MEQEQKIVTTRDIIEHQRERRREVIYPRLRERSKIIVDDEPEPKKKGTRG